MYKKLLIKTIDENYKYLWLFKEIPGKFLKNWIHFPTRKDIQV